MTLLVVVAAEAQASAIEREARSDAWQVTMYVDREGWVLRLVRDDVPTRESLSRSLGYVEGLAAAHQGRVRGFSVEDLAGGDAWTVLAAQVGDSSLNGHAPRQPATEAAVEHGATEETPGRQGLSRGA